MKKAKFIVFTTVVTLCAFVAVIYSSCKKDPCNGVTCQNGGACSGGGCVCPTGYSGNFCELSSILFTNDTYTPISITVNGSTATISAGNSITYAATPGDAAVVTAFTTGTAAAGTLTWSYTDYFPTTVGVISDPFDVSSSYFYLEMINNSASESIVSVTVNYDGLSSIQATDNVSIPNNGVIYGVGYYKAFTNTSVYAVSNTGGNWSWAPSQLALPFTDNQYTVLRAD